MSETIKGMVIGILLAISILMIVFGAISMDEQHEWEKEKEIV